MPATANPASVLSPAALNPGGMPGQDDAGFMAAQANRLRYEYVVSRGHREYCWQARRCEDFYLGGGLQWDCEIKAELEAQGRPASESNEVMGAVNAAKGYQIANRMDVQVAARGLGADEVTAKSLNLIFKSEMDRVKYRWIETEVFGDGLIQQRGYFELRISRNDQMLGEIEVRDLDPMDVIPDPDAKHYDPDYWADVTITRWLTCDEIGQLYGDQQQAVVAALNVAADPDYGDGSSDDGVPRARFGDNRTNSSYDAVMDDAGFKRYRIIDRQHHRYEMAMVAIYPTGDVQQLGEISDGELTALKAEGVLLTQRRMKRVRWTVSVCDALLHDDWSPYNHFTVIPFFPYFRRGRTRGMVDNAISPQETLNKAIAQSLHIVNSTANSGWITEEDSLANMDNEDLEDRGASTGLNIVVKKGAKYPEKIQPNQIPTGVVQLIETSRATIKSVTGVNESMLGAGQQDMSGVAIQSRQFAAQQQLALPLDNMARTRHMFALRTLELFQAYYTSEREFRITEMGQFGQPQTTITRANVVQPDGSVLADLTLGKYDIAINDQPMQITFDNSQFEQVKAMRGMNPPVAIPDAMVVRYSNLADKAEVIRSMQEQPTQQPDPAAQAAAGLAQAKSATEQAKQVQLTASANLAQANADLIRAEAVNTSVTAMYSATRAGAEVAAMPAVAPIADELLKSAGFVDKDAPPIVPAVPAGAQLPAPPASESTNPLTPPHPDVGIDAGIKRPELPP